MGWIINCTTPIWQLPCNLSSYGLSKIDDTWLVIEVNTMLVVSAVLPDTMPDLDREERLRALASLGRESRLAQHT